MNPLKFYILLASWRYPERGTTHVILEGDAARPGETGNAAGQNPVSGVADAAVDTGVWAFWISEGIGSEVDGGRG